MSDDARPTRLEHLVHWTLLSGLVVSTVLLVAGLVATLSSGRPRPEGPPPTLSALVRGALRGGGVELLDLGLLALIATPVLRVAVLAVGWAAAGRWRFALVALVVLGLLVLSLVLGVG